jgi:DNA-binding XRE family transcriptional regulator
MKYNNLCEILMKDGLNPETVSIQNLRVIAEERDVLPVVFYRLFGKPVTLSLDGIFQDYYDNYVGDAFLDARTSQGLTQGKVAKYVGSTQPAYSEYERGVKILFLPLLHRISIFLELRPQYLVRREDI